MKALLAYIIIAACIFTIQSHAAIEAVKVKPKAPQFSSALVEGVKHFENQPLASGKVKLDKIRYDKYGKCYEIGYGVTNNGVADSIAQGFLPKGYKIPNSMTRAQAEKFLIEITLPTYQKIVNKHVKVKISRKQQEALIMFTYNLGESNLKRLINGSNRLNQGNHKGTPAIMMLYSSAGGKKLRGLTRRRTYETKDLWNG
tara:strand:+ start:3565 stop:4164 length:600 start_codon:yes stop_codon:yes gene_type:complete